MDTKEIKVLMVEPGKHPRVTTLKDDLDSLQKAVSIGADYQGLIEFVSLGNGDCIMCNEEDSAQVAMTVRKRVQNDAKMKHTRNINAAFTKSAHFCTKNSAKKSCDNKRYVIKYLQENAIRCLWNAIG